MLFLERIKNIQGALASSRLKTVSVRALSRAHEEHTESVGHQKIWKPQQSVISLKRVKRIRERDGRQRHSLLSLKPVISIYGALDHNKSKTATLRALSRAHTRHTKSVGRQQIEDHVTPFLSRHSMFFLDRVKSINEALEDFRWRTTTLRAISRGREKHIRNVGQEQTEDRETPYSV